jgi:hypothetical protein
VQVNFHFLLSDAPVVQADLVITSYHYFMLKFEALELIEKVCEVFLPSIVGKITSMNEYVSSHVQHLL